MDNLLPHSQVKFDRDRPMEFSLVEESFAELSEIQQSTLDALGLTLRAYVNSAEDLLQGRYAHLRPLVPAYISTPGNILISCSPDGIAIRYETRTDECRVIAAWSDESLIQLVPMLSQNVIRCYPDRQHPPETPSSGLLLTLSATNAEQTIQQNLGFVKISFDSPIEKPEHVPIPPNKPFCLLSIRNELEIRMNLRPLQRRTPDELVIVRSQLRLPVGWECIEVYPFTDVNHWKPEYASVWAERDILASVAAHHVRENQYQSLDPNAAARRELGLLLKSYKDLLNSNPESEELLQKFLCENPVLLCPAHDRMWPKVALGARKTDFVFREAAGDYMLVELERSTHRLFLKNGDSSRELDHARGQIVDWKRYLEDNLSTTQREIGLTGISANPKGLIVIGRGSSLTVEERRKLVSIENESPKLKIMTYDDVHDNAKAVIENLLGPILESYGNTQIYHSSGKRL